MSTSCHTRSLVIPQAGFGRDLFFRCATKQRIPQPASEFPVTQTGKRRSEDDRFYEEPTLASIQLVNNPTHGTLARSSSADWDIKGFSAWDARNLPSSRSISGNERVDAALARGIPRIRKSRSCPFSSRCRFRFASAGMDCARARDDGRGLRSR